jgi:hypothetical protein
MKIDDKVDEGKTYWPSGERLAKIVKAVNSNRPVTEKGGVLLVSEEGENQGTKITIDETKLAELIESMMEEGLAGYHEQEVQACVDGVSTTITILVKDA